MKPSKEARNKSPTTPSRWIPRRQSSGIVLLVGIISKVSALKRERWRLVLGRPSQLESLRSKPALQIVQFCRRVTNGARGIARLHCPRGNGPRGFSNVPFHGMESIAPVGDMRNAEVFAARQQIAAAVRNQRAKRDLKTQRGDIDVIVAACRRMQVETIVAHAEESEKACARGFSISGNCCFRAASPTCCSSTVNSALMRRDSRIYGALARPSLVPSTSFRKRRPFQPALPSGRGASVCIQ